MISVTNVFVTDKRIYSCIPDLHLTLLQQKGS